MHLWVQPQIDLAKFHWDIIEIISIGRNNWFTQIAKKLQSRVLILILRIKRFSFLFFMTFFISMLPALPPPRKKGEESVPSIK